jgi:glutamate-1-semialdehyde 2,1-aminomutase
MSRVQSEAIFSKLCEVIPGGVNSPVRSGKGTGQSPMVADWASGDMLYDADGHSYIDYCGSWGALIHGHAHPTIIDAAAKRMVKGSSFGITTSIEEKLARKITTSVPSIEKIRFVSSGTEATMSAARLARGFTGRKWLVKFAGHYHGHADFFLVQAGSGVAGLNPTSSSAGIPEEVIKYTCCLPFNDEKAFEQFMHSQGSNVAAVIMEPIAGNIGVVPSKLAFLQKVREITKKYGTLLILDEVITGFRVGLQGAQGLYGIKPDLTTFGKVIGGGFPAAAFGGRKAIMDYLAPLGPVYQAGTLSGNPVAMEAGLQALTLCDEKGFYEQLEQKTKVIIDPIKQFLKEKDIQACVQQVGSMFTIFFGKKEVNNMEDALQTDQQEYARFFRYLFANGVYIPPLQLEAWFVSTHHKEENLIRTRDLILKFFST